MPLLGLWVVLPMGLQLPVLDGLVDDIAFERVQGFSVVEWCLCMGWPGVAVWIGTRIALEKGKRQRPARGFEVVMLQKHHSHCASAGG